MVKNKNPLKNTLETGLTSPKPVKALLSLAADHIKNGRWQNLSDIDAMLADRFIGYIRDGIKDDLDEFLKAVLSFIDSKSGDKLKLTEEGKSYFYRWEHFHDLCGIAAENYDHDFTSRLLESRKHGNQLLEILFDEKKGVRFKVLAEKLGISNQNLAKLLREFEEAELVVRQRHKNVTTVKVGFIGKIYMEEKETDITSTEDIGLDMGDELNMEEKAQLNRLAKQGSPKNYLLKTA